MAMRLASPDSLRGAVIESRARIVGVPARDPLWRDLRALVVENRLRAPITGAHLLHKKLWVWEGWPSSVRDHVELRINGIPWVLPPVERLEPDPRETRRALVDVVEHNPEFAPFEGYLLEVAGSGEAVLEPAGWVAADRASDLVDVGRGRRGVPHGCAYIGIELAPRALRPPEIKEPASEIADLGLRIQTVNALRQRNVQTVEQLLGLSDRDLHRLPGIGAIAVREIDAALADHGLHLPADGRER